ncbi:MAG TPA: ATP-binding protein [Candidatus Omnitrophota bacterium]|nr:ATP-binding protein [Candidatus Omnitrophota bacterium]
MKKRSPKPLCLAKRSPLSFCPGVSHAKSFLDLKCRSFLELTGDMVQLFDPDGRILEVNFAWKESLEYTDEDLAHLNALKMIRPEDQQEAKEVFRVVSKDGKPRRFRATLFAKNGMELAVEGIVGRLPVDKKSFALFSIFHDVTLHRNYEQLKDEFVSTISHELRTPLTVVREGASQIRDELLGPVSTDQKVLLDMILQNSDRLGRIIEKLLDVSSLEAGKIHLHRTRCDLVGIAHSVIRSFKDAAKQKGLEFLTEFAPEKIELYVDQEKITQVLTNLIHNALIFTEQGHIKVHLRIRESFVECKVSDTGKGISKSDLANAFQKFRQFSREIGPGDRGTGLGLPICKKLIELHHGHIKIESAAGKGTTVSFLLPQHTHRDFFKSAISQAMTRCVEERHSLSVIVFNILDFEFLEEKFGAKQVERAVSKMEQIIGASLRRAADITVKNSKVIMVLLPDTAKEKALVVLGRLSQVLEDYLTKEKKTGSVKIHSSVVCFPDEAKSLDEILDKIYT